MNNLYLYRNLVGILLIVHILMLIICVSDFVYDLNRTEPDYKYLDIEYVQSQQIDWSKYND